MTLWNLILEPLEERYTKQWAEWSKRDFARYFDDIRTIEVEPLTDKVEVGKVLDANGTIYWKAEQMTELAFEFSREAVKDGDIFFLHDLQFPGWEAIKYMAELNNVRIRVFGFLHASSWTEGDFAQPMEPWLAPYELAWINAADGIFVGSHYHKKKIVEARRLPEILADKIYVTGNPVDIQVYRSGCTSIPKPHEKQNLVLWPHRFHLEKNPQFAVDCVEWWFETAKHDKHPVKFIFRAPDKTALQHSSIQLLMIRLRQLQEDIAISFYEPQNKQEYYDLMSQCKIMWSTSLEESFGYCTAEGVALDCHPILPNCAAHPELVRRERYLYKPNDLQDCCNKIAAAIEQPSPPTIYIEEYEESFDRMAQIMTDKTGYITYKEGIQIGR